MSIITSKVQHLEAQLGEFQQQINDQVESNIRSFSQHTCLAPEHIAALKDFSAILSAQSKEHSASHPHQLISLLSNIRSDLIVLSEHFSSSNLLAPQCLDLSWLIAVKACLRVLAITLKTLSGDVLALEEEILYWEESLDTHWYIGLYSVQTSPSRLWRRFTEKHMLGHESDNNRPVSTETANTNPPAPSSRWSQFHNIIRRCLLPQSRGIFLTEMLSPLTRSRVEIQRKRKNLRDMKDFNASAIGLLTKECLSLERKDHNNSAALTGEGLHDAALRSINMMEALLKTAANNRIPQFDSAAFNKLLLSQIHLGEYHHTPQGPQSVIERLIYILERLLPRYQKVSADVTHEFGRPSPLARYWLPLTVGVISLSTSLKPLKDQAPAILRWIRNFGVTTVEFWSNWVVDPTLRLIRTIKHDEQSEIALMSKNSLAADRQSLERMVVDFVLDRSEPMAIHSSTDFIANKVREGDLTPVLKAYEKDLRSPFIGTIRGDLVRALLIQIQKTKVDVEIAISGIDALLKSQELVFGFVGLTPGILVSYALIRWFFGLFNNRKGFRLGKQQDDLRYALRNIHRILTSTPKIDSHLTYKDHGLLICNIETLYRMAERVLKRDDLLVFQEDIADLINESRVEWQLKIIERMTWTYSKWT